MLFSLGFHSFHSPRLGSRHACMQTQQGFQLAALMGMPAGQTVCRLLRLYLGGTLCAIRRIGCLFFLLERIDPVTEYGGLFKLFGLNGFIQFFFQLLHLAPARFRRILRFLRSQRDPAAVRDMTVQLGDVRRKHGGKRLIAGRTSGAAAFGDIRRRCAADRTDAANRSNRFAQCAGQQGADPAEGIHAAESAVRGFGGAGRAEVKLRHLAVDILFIVVGCRILFAFVAKHIHLTFPNAVCKQADIV